MLSAVKSLWNGWKRIAKKIGDFQAAVIHTVMYWTVTGLMHLVSRLKGGVKEFSKAEAESYWTPKSAGGMDEKERLRHQF